MRHLKITTEDLSYLIEFEWHMDEWGSTKKHLIRVTQNNESKVYDFGCCAGFGLRKVHHFFGDHSIDKVKLGFRHPHIMLYDLTRDKQNQIILQIEDTSEPSPTILLLGKDFNIDGLRSK